MQFVVAAAHFVAATFSFLSSDKSTRSSIAE
jgi:hypothetical protein